MYAQHHNAQTPPRIIKISKRAIEKKAAALSGISQPAYEMHRAAAEGYRLGKLAAGESNLGRNIMTGAASLALGGAVIGLGNIGFQALQRGMASLTEGRDKSKAVSEMLRVNPHLAKEEKTKVLQAFDTLWRFNQDVAKDPLASASFVQKTVDYGGVTTDEVKKMVDMRKAMRDADARTPQLQMFPMTPGQMF